MAANLDRMNELIDWIAQGKIVEAIDEFYHPDCEMQENLNEPCVGIEANKKREEEFLAAVKEWKTFNVTAKGEGENVTFYESDFSFLNTDDQLVEYNQVSVQRWKDGKIIHERFYYDSAK